MNQNVVFAFLVIAVSAVLAHPHHGRNEAIVPPIAVLPSVPLPAVIAKEAEAPPAPAIPSSPSPEASSSVAPAKPEETPTVLPLSDEAAVTAQPTTLPASASTAEVAPPPAEVAPPPADIPAVSAVRV